MFFSRDILFDDQPQNELQVKEIARDVFNRMLSELKQQSIPEPPSYLFDWNEEQDVKDMTGLDIDLTS